MTESKEYKNELEDWDKDELLDYISRLEHNIAVLFIAWQETLSRAGKAEDKLDALDT